MKYNLFDRDTAYWNEFYKNELASSEPSLFAKYVWEKYLKNFPGKLVDLGCGNGRDSFYFLENGLDVTAIDASQNAIKILEANSLHKGDKIRFICGDFVNNIKDLGKFYYCYSRFSLHAITDKQECELIKSVYEMLDSGGLFLIEARCILDDLYGKGEKVGKDSYIYDNHFRRFIRIGELITSMENLGFIIEEASERKGFAPYKDEDPYILRCIGRKM